MTDLDVFLPHILPKAPGCPIPTARQAIVQAAITFCENTKFWRSCDEFTTTAEDCSHICAPSGAEIHEIENATFDGKRLEPASLAFLDREHPQWRTNAQGGSPRFVTQIAPDTVRFVPGQAGHARIWTVLKPSEDAEQLPAFLASKYRRTIADGALGDILALPGQPFTSAEMSTAYATRFITTLNTLFDQALRGQQRAPLRSRPQFF